MWTKTMALVACYFAILCLAEQFAPRSSFLQNGGSADDGNRVGRHRLKRTLSSGYCKQRGCCSGRDDGCIFPYSTRNASCYCDDFCSSDPPEAMDCCPDFWTVCLGRASRHPQHIRIAPLQQMGCLQGGQHFTEGATFIDNCNSCRCINSHWKCSDTTCLVQPSLIKQINSGNYGWEAGNYSQFWGMSLKEVFSSRLGTFPPSADLLGMRPITESLMAETNFPEFFVARYEWPGWIHDPLDQRNCSASWAFSTASVAADRIAIHSKGQFTGNLSPQNLISCDTKKDQNGCKGGSLRGAWSYLKKHGLVSHACYPLFWNQLQQKGCAISSEVDEDGKRRATQPCPNNLEPSNRIYQCGSPYRISSQETEIMKEIIENGPVQVMQVYEDFFLYKSGIYKHSRSAGAQPQHGHQKRTHSVKIVGCKTNDN